MILNSLYKYLNFEQSSENFLSGLARIAICWKNDEFFEVNPNVNDINKFKN
jgi:hypothetical protein